MAKESFSSKLKLQLADEVIKKKCCRFTFNAVLSAKGTDSVTVISEIYEKCRCNTCRDIFIRALFIVFGSVTDPEKAYHLDFTFKTVEQAAAVQKILAEAGHTFKMTTRRDKFVLYIKESSMIEDFLVYIGASGAAFDIMNTKIMHEFRNSVNRQVNCDTANISKQLAAVKKVKSAVELLVKLGKYDTLQPELKEAARLRIDNEQLSIADIGKLANPPITKSGMKHRLEKILTIANDSDEEVSSGE